MGTVVQFPARSVLPFRARSVVPIGHIANGLRRVAENFKGLHYASGSGEPIAAHMARAKPMAALPKDNCQIPLKFDPCRQHLDLHLPDKPWQRVHVLATEGNHFQAVLADSFEPETYPYFNMIRERHVFLNGDGNRLTSGQTGLDEFYLKVTAADVLLKGLFEVMGTISESTLAARAFVAAQFLMALYITSESTGVVLLADGVNNHKYTELKPESLKRRDLALNQIKQKLGPSADGFDLFVAPSPKAHSMARIRFTGLQDCRDPELMIRLSENPSLAEPALLREELLKLYAQTESRLP